MSVDFNHLREFDRFRLDPERKVLWADSATVTLPLKEIEILCVLTDVAGEVVTKSELLDRVWGDSFVEESNLSQHIYRLRKAFKSYGASADLIQTIPRRGYRFTGEVSVSANERVVIEKRTLTQTVIEQIDPCPAEVGSVSEIDPHVTVSRAAVQTRLRIVAGLAGLIVILVFSGFIFDRITNTSTDGIIRSVGVLPIRSLNNTEGESIRALGLTDALVTQIGRIGDLRVVSLLAVNGSRLQTSDPSTLGSEIGVDTVLDGTIQQEGNEVRISLRLIRSRDGAQLWSTTLRENAESIFKVQDAMAYETSRALSRSIRPELIKHLTENRDAYDAFLRGRFFLDKRIGSYYPKAAAEFERAIDLDPQFAAAYSGLADVFALQANISSGTKRDSLYNSSKAMALRALEIDPSSAHARTSLAWVKRVHEWDWQGAEADFRKAIELDSNYAPARQWYALLLTTLGRHDEALYQVEKARELEPLSKSVILNYFTVRQYRGEADLLPAIVEQAESLEETRPTNTRLIVASYFRRQDYRTAIEFGESLIARDATLIRSDYVASQLAISYFKLGDRKNTQRFVDHLEKRAAISTEAAYRLALFHSATGNYEVAIGLLEKCLLARDDRMVWLNVEPEFVDLRKDPRFRLLVEKMRLA